jgi:hypothetical protein
MSRLPKIVRNLAEDNYLIYESIKRMAGKTIKKVRYGTRESIKGVHESEVLHIEFTDGEILAIDTGSNLIEFQSKMKPENIHIDFMFTWEPETPSS